MRLTYHIIERLCATIRAEAEAHAAFFGNPGDWNRIHERMKVSWANVYVAQKFGTRGALDYLKKYW